MNIDWDKKPSWADVWIESLVAHVKSNWAKESGGKYIFKDLSFVQRLEKPELYKVHYPPETKPKWNGEGLPPVGTVCDLVEYGRPTVEIIAHARNKASDVAIYKYYDIDDKLQTGFKIAGCFHPIKSDKEKWIEQSIEIASRSAAECDVTFSNAIYEALKSGELPIPKGINNESK